MDDSDALNQRILNDKSAKYRGTARVSFTHLYFPNPSRDLDKRVVNQLIRDFEGEGCQRNIQAHRIPAVIDDDVLLAALSNLAIDAETFKATSENDPPLFSLDRDIRLDCLHGQHRIAAGREFLSPSQKWWVVDLFSQDLDNETRRALREGCSYSEPYSSGEIFRYARLCQRNNDQLGEQTWKSRLSPHQERYLNIIIKRKLLINALDLLLDIPGLWRTFYVGSLNDLIHIGFDEEISRYINGVNNYWRATITPDIADVSAIDSKTVEDIHLRVPAWSKSDAAFIQDGMRLGRLFSAITDSGGRSKVTRRLLRTEDLIPSLWTLISNIRYLKAPAKILKSILPDKPKGVARKRGAKTIRQRFYHCYTRIESNNDRVEIHESVTSTKFIEKHGYDVFDVCYQQLILYSYRASQDPNPLSLQNMAILASQMGFSSPQIEWELKQDPVLKILKDVVTRALAVVRPNQEFDLDSDEAKALSKSLQEFMNNLLKAPADGEPLIARSGCTSADHRDLNHLFLTKIHRAISDYQKLGDEVSSFLVKRSRHLAFFGALKSGTSGSSLETHSLSLETVQILEDPETSFPVEDTSTGQILKEPTVSRPEVKSIRFVEGSTIIDVAFIKDDVNRTAKSFATQGKSLSLRNGGNIVWEDCYRVLTNSGQVTVMVHDPNEPRLGDKRQRPESWSKQQELEVQTVVGDLFEEEEEEL